MSNAASALSVPEKSSTERLLPSGRSIVLRVAGSREELEVRSPAGDVELKVTLTADGPVLSLREARLEIESLETVALTCKRFEVSTSEATVLESRGSTRIEAREVRVATTDDIHLDGAMIRLNSPEGETFKS